MILVNHQEKIMRLFAFYSHIATKTMGRQSKWSQPRRALQFTEFDFYGIHNTDSLLKICWLVAVASYYASIPILSWYTTLYRMISLQQMTQ
jgi:hypothetical protein